MNTNKVDKAESGQASEIGSPESRHEGPVTFHGPGGAEAKTVDLGEAVLAATRRKLLPAWAFDQLMREARAGSKTSLHALASSAANWDSEFPDDLMRAMESLADEGDAFSKYLIGLTDVVHGRANGSELQIKTGLKPLRSASDAGVGEATWAIALHEGLTGRPIIAKEQAEKSAGQRYFVACEAVDYSESVNGLIRMHAQAAAATARPVDPVPKADQSGAEQLAKIRSLEHQVFTLKAEKEAATARAVDAEAMVGAQQERVAKDEAVDRYARALERTNWALVEANEEVSAARRQITELTMALRNREAEIQVLYSRIARKDELLSSRGRRRRGSNPDGNTNGRVAQAA